MRRDVEAELRGRPQPDNTDRQIARDASEAIRSDQPEIASRIRVLAHQGHITLEGTVEWRHQRERAEATVRHVRGVVSVNNALIVTPCAEPADIKKSIQAAFKHGAELDANQISVQTDGGQVVLTGHVRTSFECTEAEKAALSTPGVTEVRNEITVGP